MIRRVGFTAAVLLLLGAVVPALPASAQTTPQMQVAARRIIAQRMVDPDSLQFRNIRRVSVTVDGFSRPVLCGEFNARNRMGGYNGFKTFTYDAQEQLVVALGGLFFSDRTGDFDLEQFSQQRLPVGADIAARVEEFNRRTEAYRSHLMRCA